MQFSTQVQLKFNSNNSNNSTQGGVI